MPTFVYFVGAEKPVRLEDDYQSVNKQLGENDAGQFTLSNGVLATIYKSAIAYIAQASEPWVASA